MKRLTFAACLIALLWSVVLLPLADAQVAFGLQKFGSFDGGQFDTVNLGDLDLYFSVPIVHKAGRGIPFTYDLNYDSSMSQPVNFGAYSQWQPITNIGGVAVYWGWQGLGPVFTPYLSYTATYSQGTCGMS